MITATTIKLIASAMAGTTGMAVLAATEAATQPAGVEQHLTLATGAVACTITLFAALRHVVNKLLQAKDDQITALRLREEKERKRADDAEAELREELADRARRAEGDEIPRQSRRHHE